MEMIVRPIVDSDLPAVLEVYHQCEDFLALGPNPYASPEMVAADRELSSEHGGEYCGLFNEDDQLMGVFDFIRSGFEGDAACAFLELLMIASPYRAQGLGAKAVAWLLNELRRAGITRLRSGVQVNNPDAIRFWQRMGFKIITDAQQMDDGTVCYQLEKILER